MKQLVGVLQSRALHVVVFHIGGQARLVMALQLKFSKNVGKLVEPLGCNRLRVAAHRA